MQIAHYFAAYREGLLAAERMLDLDSGVPAGSKMHCVFRYHFPVSSDPRLAGLGKYFLYDNLPKLSQKEIEEAERSLNVTFGIIRQMHTLSMFRSSKGLPTDEFFAQIVASWRKFYRENKIDMFVGSLMDDYCGIIGAEVAKSMGIPILAPSSGGRFTRAYIITDGDFYPIFYKRLPKGEVDKVYSQALAAMDKETVTNPSISKLADSYFNIASPSIFLRLAAAFPASIKEYYFARPKVERLMWLSPFELANRQLWWFLHSKFSSLLATKKPLQGEKYVFFPLHFSMDAALRSLTPLADQILLVEEIAKVLPSGTKLYVKPHPHWRCSDIGMRQMLRMSAIPNVRLLDYHCSTKELIQGCEYVVIINSSVGFEALIQHKKVVSFGVGYPPEIVPRVASPQELMHADKIEMDWDACKEFVANSYSHCIYHENQEEFNVGGWTRSFSAKIFAAMADTYSYLRGRHSK